MAEKIVNLPMKVSGVTHDNEDTGTSRQAILKAIYGMIEGGHYVLKLVRDYVNQYDKNAIRVWITTPTPHVTGDTVGFIPREYAKFMAPLMDQGMTFNIKVKEIGQMENGTWYCEILINQG